MADLTNLLAKGISTLKLSSTEKQRTDLVELVEQLLKWNKTYNLTAITNPTEVLKLHILDSLAVIPLIKSDNIVDIGTGPGFPGLPLAIMLPQVKITLLDSNSKKIRFIRQIVHSLDLDNVTVIHSRVEDYKIKKFSAIISRAFASISDMVLLTQHLLSPDGSWLAMKGQYKKEELNYEELGITEVAYTELQIPGLDAERCLIEFKPR